MNSEKKVEFYTSSPAFAKQMLGDALSFQQTIMNDFTQKAWSEWEQKLKAYLKDNLKQFGYEFATDDEFLNFCKERVNRICFEDNPNYYEFYLDYVNEENTGKLIGACSDEIEFVNDFENNKITVIIGKSIA